MTAHTKSLDAQISSRTLSALRTRTANRTHAKEQLNYTTFPPAHVAAAFCTNDTTDKTSATRMGCVARRGGKPYTDILAA